MSSTSSTADVHIQRMDIAAIIKGYTLDAAYQLHLEQELGSIEVGKKADLVVLDRNLFELPTYKIHKAKVTGTYIDGKRVYSAD